MNKKLLLLMMAVFCFAAGNVLAQDSDKGFYFTIGGGYSLGTAKTSGGGNGLMPMQNVSTKNVTTITRPDGNYQSSVNNSTTRKNAAYSVGEGINLSVGFGYMLTKNIGVELGANYMMGTEASIEEKTDKQTRYNYSVKIGSTTYMTGGSTRDLSTKEYSMTRNTLALTPAIKLVAPLDDKKSLYSRFGVVLPVMDKIDYEYSNHSEYVSTRPGSESESKSKENKTTEYQSYFNLGYTAALGFQYNMGKLALFAEVSFLSSSFEVKKSEITEWTSSSNGGSKKDLLEGINTSAKETEYKKEYTTTDKTPAQDKDKPSKDTSFSLPGSSIGITVGLAFRF